MCKIFSKPLPPRDRTIAQGGKRGGSSVPAVRTESSVRQFSCLVCSAAAGYTYVCKLFLYCFDTDAVQCGLFFYSF